MSRKRKNGRPFVMIEKSVLRSEAWKDLTPAEVLVYIHLKSNYNGANNGDIAFPYADMDGIMSKPTVAKSLKGLIGKGWIEKTQHGGLYRYYCLYKLTGAHEILR